MTESAWLLLGLGLYLAAMVAVGALILIRFLPEDRLEYVPTAIVGPVKAVPALDPGQMLPRLESFAEAITGADSLAASVAASVAAESGADPAEGALVSTEDAGSAGSDAVSAEGGAADR